MRTIFVGDREYTEEELRAAVDRDRETTFERYKRLRSELAESHQRAINSAWDEIEDWLWSLPKKSP